MVTPYRPPYFQMQLQLFLYLYFKFSVDHVVIANDAGLVPSWFNLVLYSSGPTYSGGSPLRSRHTLVACVRNATTLDLDELGHRENWPPVQRTSIV